MPNNGLPTARLTFVVSIMITCVGGLGFLLMYSVGPTAPAEKLWDDEIIIPAMIIGAIIVGSFCKGFPRAAEKLFLALLAAGFALAVSVMGGNWLVSNDPRPDNTVGWVIGIALSIIAGAMVLFHKPKPVQRRIVLRDRTSTDTSGRQRRHIA